MSSHSNIVDSANTGDKLILSWSVHLVHESPQRMIWIVPLVVATCFCGARLMGPLGVLVASLAMLSSLSDYLFPVRFEISAERAVCKRLVGFSEIRWENVKTFYLDDMGIKLSPLRKATRLEAYRGVYLRFNESNKEQVIETVRSLRDAHV